MEVSALSSDLCCVWDACVVPSFYTCSSSRDILMQLGFSQKDTDVDA
jgi:hypothetical protein